MKFIELAEEFIAMGVYSRDTESKIKTAADLFDRRAAVSLEDLSIRAIGDFKDSTLKVAKVVSYNGYLRYLRLIVDFAVSCGYVEHNIFRAAKLGAVGRATHKVIEDETLIALLAHVTAYEHCYSPAWFWRAVIVTLYFTGMRRRQLVTLRVADINLMNFELHLRVEGSKTKREWSIPIHPRLANELNRYMKHVIRDLGRTLSNDEPFFNIVRHNSKYSACTQHPEQMPAASVTGFFKRVNKRAKLGVSAHKFRHTLATKICNPADGEADIFSAQQILGHTMIQTTRAYVKTSHTQMKSALEKISLPE
jgi:integrase